MNSAILLVFLFAFLGAMARFVIGWADSKDPTTGKPEPFDSRKFLSTFLRSLVQSAGWTALYTLAGPLTWVALLTVLAAGAGAETLWHDSASAVAPVKPPAKLPTG